MQVEASQKGLKLFSGDPWGAYGNSGGPQNYHYGFNATPCRFDLFIAEFILGICL